MKPTLFLLCILISAQSSAQEQDSLFHKNGFVLQFKSAFVDQLGYKYKASTSLTYFLRGTITNEKNTISSSNAVDETLEFDTYIATVGIEYVLTSVEHLSVFAIVSGGVTVNTSQNPFYVTNQHFDYRNSRQTTYSFRPGFGVEYYFTKQFSLSGYQILTYDYSKERVALADPNSPYAPSTSTATSLRAIDATIAITFYF
jgi:hypothetical protein